MVALSKEFYKQLNSIENFSNLPDDDPQVVEIRKRVAYELREPYGEPIKRNLVSAQSSTYSETTMDNLTPMRYIYLIQNDVFKNHLVKKLGVGQQLFDRWLIENKLTKKHLQKYHIFKDDKLVDVVDTLNEIRTYIDFSKDYIHSYIENGETIKGGWVIKRVYTFEPDVEGLNDFKEEETFGYWYDKRPSRRGLTRDE